MMTIIKCILAGSGIFVAGVFIVAMGVQIGLRAYFEDYKKSKEKEVKKNG